MSGTTESNPERVGWCHRAVTKAAALMFSVVALTVVTGTGRVQAEAPPIKIAHQLERDSGRLVLEFPKPVDYAVERVGADIYIRFSQPIVGDLGPAQRSLTRYVSEMRAAGAGRVLVIRMTGQPRMTHYRRGNIVTIVWLGAGQATPATAEKRPDSKPAENKPSDNKAAEAPAKPPEAKPVDPKPAEPKAAEKPAATPKAEEKPAEAK